MDGTEHTITLLVRQTNGTTIEHSVASLAISISELKASLSQCTGIPKERIRLMFENRILDDEKTIEHYDMTPAQVLRLSSIDNNSVLRLVQLAGNHATHPRNVSGINSVNSAPRMSPAETMGNQARQMFLSNPQLAQNMMMANPQMREAMENNPELRQMMNDPEIMQQSLNAAQNPRLMQEVQRNNDRVLSNLETSPGGFAHIRRMYHNIQEPLAQAAESSTRYSLDELNRRRAKVMGVTKPDKSRVNTTPLPNPWARRPSQLAGRPGFDVRNPLAMVDQVSRNTDRLARLNLSASQSTSPRRSQLSGDDPLSLMQLQRQLGTLPSLVSAAHEPQGNTGRAAAGGSSQSPTSPRAISAMSIVNPAYAHNSSPQMQSPAMLSDSERSQFSERYRDELDQLEDMGFPDREKNLRALIACQGDLSEAVVRIAGSDN
ncbi:hypothetical protein IW147_004781 [Coemansia sp. RSA 720]|nr:hypothetical protein IW147_004781 [Coemansia sp. RSA 720]